MEEMEYSELIITLFSIIQWTMTAFIMNFKQLQPNYQSIITTYFIISSQINMCSSTTSSYWNSVEASQWKYQTINCTQNQRCDIICDEEASCQQSTLVCPADNECNIQCNAYLACYFVCESTYFFCV